MGVRREGKTGICLPLKIGTKNQKFLENLRLAAKFRLIHVTRGHTAGFFHQDLFFVDLDV